MERSNMHTHYMGLAGSALRTAIGVVAGLCFIAFGYGQSDIGGLMITDSFNMMFPQFATALRPHSYHTAVLSGAVVSTWNIGCFVGAFFTIFLGDRLGRKGTIMVGLVIEPIGKLIQVSSFTLGQYVAGRVIAGIGNGFIAATIPAWQAECLKTHRRGTLLLVSFGTCITFGVALAYWIIYAMSFTQPSSVSWRFPIAFAILFTLPALIIVCFMPESPRWLLLQGREKEAASVLSALNELPQDSEDIRRELLSIKYAVKHMASAPATDVAKNGQFRNLQRTVLAVGLQIMQQFTGVNLFIQYLGSMFRIQLRYEVRESMVLAACSSTWFFLASLFAVVAIDRFWGRRTLTMFGAAGMCVCMIFLASFNWAGEHGMPWGFHAMTVFLFLYNTCFSIGWQGMSWMWAVELIPLGIRGPANAMSTAANWLSNYIVVLVAPVMFANSLWRTYIFFAVMNFVFVPIIWFFYPETGSRSLEEVDMLFKVAGEKGNAWFSAVRAAKEEPRWFDKNGEPTDSYGESSEKSEYDPERGSVSGESPDSQDRTRPSLSGKRQKSDSSNRAHAASPDDWDDRGPAPSPVINRTHSRPGT